MVSRIQIFTLVLAAAGAYQLFLSRRNSVGFPGPPVKTVVGEGAARGGLKCWDKIGTVLSKNSGFVILRIHIELGTSRMINFSCVKPTDKQHLKYALGSVGSCYWISHSLMRLCGRTNSRQVFPNCFISTETLLEVWFPESVIKSELNKKTLFIAGRYFSYYAFSLITARVHIPFFLIVMAAYYE